MSLRDHDLMPEDATPEEAEFIEYAIVNLYSSIEAEEDMFLVAFVHDLGYKKKLAAEILGISPAAVTLRLKRIQNRLRNGYAKNRVKKQVE